MATETRSIDLEQITNLTFDQVNKYLTRFDAEHPCEACGHSEWLIDEVDGKALFVSSPLAHNPDQGMVFLPLTCEKCGNTRFLNAAVIAMDIAKNEANNVKAE
ncbi:hypothetical protein NUV66_06300 [Pseudomonas sp. 32.2.56]|uniref:hypothetical protein n=1 Tax=Pseudomonas sp. 32.2.56 TaxID=2969303 RepID=UPI00215010CC|nr:hypothetical protein [Pseudomonas sp. 32.2.56]MCR4508910.1 hypothetical protein [Pseudomonas sp. 32.2.56]